ncbi:MAG: hypothetical protein M1820_004402 [Bogoriella megaspora]|nr:MAG: hypothetical protein M1820_004402 [Bogoriella megaspora]
MAGGSDAEDNSTVQSLPENAEVTQRPLDIAHLLQTTRKPLSPYLTAIQFGYDKLIECLLEEEMQHAETLQGDDRKAEDPSVYKVLLRHERLADAEDQPVICINYFIDMHGRSPTPNQLKQILELMQQYCLEEFDSQVDKADNFRDLVAGLSATRSGNMKRLISTFRNSVRGKPSQEHIDVISDFIDALEQRFGDLELEDLNRQECEGSIQEPPKLRRVQSSDELNGSRRRYSFLQSI